MNRSFSEQLASLFPEAKAGHAKPISKGPVLQTKPTHCVVDHEAQRMVFEGSLYECRRHVRMNWRSMTVERLAQK